MRDVWLKRLAYDDKHLITVIQYCRNEITICSFLASSSVILALGLLNVLGMFKDFQGVTSAFNVVGANNAALLVIKVGILIICYFISFMDSPFAFDF
jgi:uncharacterized membrane protein